MLAQAGDGDDLGLLRDGLGGELGALDPLSQKARETTTGREEEAGEEQPDPALDQAHAARPTPRRPAPRRLGDVVRARLITDGSSVVGIARPIATASWRMRSLPKTVPSRPFSAEFSSSSAVFLSSTLPEERRS